MKEKQRVDAVRARLVPPHKLISRKVTEADLARVVEDVRALHEICFMQVGNYQGAYAMHHSQIDDKDPLSLFVTMDRLIVVNPVITRHSNYTTDSKEACVSYPDRPEIIVPRWPKCEVEYETIMIDPTDKNKFKLSGIQHQSVSGRMAFIWQHELDHGNAQFIYQ